MSSIIYRGVELHQTCGAPIDDSRMSYWQSECELYEVSKNSWSKTYFARFRPFISQDMYYLGTGQSLGEALDDAVEQAKADFLVWKEKIFKDLG